MRLMTLIVLIICTLAAEPSCKKGNAEEKEPNNDYATATVIEIDTPMKGKLSTAGDVDCYYIDVAEPSSFDISLGAVKGVNIAMKISRKKDNGDIEVLKIIDDNRKSSPERMVNMWFGAGRYFIVVCFGEKDPVRGNDEDLYELNIGAHRQDEYSEKEPNDDRAHASELILDRKYAGYLCPSLLRNTDSGSVMSREEDWYFFNAEVSDDVKTVCDVSYHGIPGIQAKVSIRDENMDLIMEETAEAGTNEISLNDIGIKRSGKYYIVISSARVDSNCDSPYFLSAVLHGYDYSGELEPNNRTDIANEVKDDVINGFLYPSNDHDFFRIEPGGAIMFSAEGEFPAGMSGGIRIYDANGKIIFEGKADETGAPVKIMPFYVDKPIWLETFIAKGAGNKTSEYRIKLTKDAYSGGTEKENNDTIKNAQIITEGTYECYINRADDKDWYQINSVANKTYTIKVRWGNDSTGRLSVTDKKGYIIRTERVSSDHEKTVKELVEDKAYILIEPDRYKNGVSYFITVE